MPVRNWIQPSTLVLVMALCAVTLGFAGCDANVKFRNPLDNGAAKKKAEAEQKRKMAEQVVKQRERAEAAAKMERENEARKSMIKTTSIMGGGSKSFGSFTKSEARSSVSENLDKLRREIQSSVEFAPTLVVWLIDATPSAQDLRNEWSDAARKMYSDFAANGVSGNGASPNALYTAMATVGGVPQTLIDKPTIEYDQIGPAIDQLASDSSGREMTFTIVENTVEKYAASGSTPYREVLIVLITDEAGDDENKLDATVEKVRKAGARVHVVGVPAPFGRMRPEGRSVEPNTKLGPETRYPQMVEIQFSSDSFASSDVDSGYGPYGLNYLARATGGAYLLSRTRGGAWPGSAMRFPDNVMQEYPPKFVSDADYQALINSNKAIAALHMAARQTEVGGMNYPSAQFQMGDEARLKNQLDQAQRISARLGPEIDAIYQPLEDAEDDRAKITDKRLQASFDLALGRAAASKARIDGYNQMLAILKGGKKFENPASDTWALEPADTLEEAGSRLERLRIKAKENLQRVIDEHPDTPWAYFAERELQSEIGWKWVEH